MVSRLESGPISRVNERLTQGASRKHQMLADFVLRESDEAAFLSAGEIARVVGMSESTVVRFAMSLGYAGFPEFQREMQRLLRDELSTIRRQTAKAAEPTSDPAQEIFHAEISNLERSLSYLQRSSLDQIVDDILRADNIYVLGLRASSCLAEHMGYQLKTITSEVEVITTGGADVLYKLNERPSGLMLTFAFPRYPRETVEITEHARKLGIHTVAITDSAQSPLCEYADEILFAHTTTHAFVDLYSAAMSTISAIVAQASLKDEARVLAGLSRFEKRAQQARLFIGRDEQEPKYSDLERNG